MNKKLKNNLEKKIRVIPNFPKKGIQFQDITSITDSKQLFTEVVNEISKYCKKNKFTKVAGIEAEASSLDQLLPTSLACLLFQ